VCVCVCALHVSSTIIHRSTVPVLLPRFHLPNPPVCSVFGITLSININIPISIISHQHLKERLHHDCHRARLLVSSHPIPSTPNHFYRCKFPESVFVCLQSMLPCVCLCFFLVVKNGVFPFKERRNQKNKTTNTQQQLHPQHQQPLMQWRLLRSFRRGLGRHRHQSLHLRLLVLEHRRCRMIQQDA